MNTANNRASSAPRVVARQLALAFTAVALVAICMGAVLLGLVAQVSGLVYDMRRDESAIRRGLDLATAVREQYIHIAHSLVEHDRSHLDHYEDWRTEVRKGIEELAPMAPADELWRADAVARTTDALHEGFIQVLLPALDRGDAAAVLAEHRRLEQLAEDAATHADALARGVESRMAHSHVRATRATTIGLVAGGLGVLLVIVLSVAFTLRLRATALKPLETLAAAARRFGSGDFGARVGRVGAGELEALAHAFDRMAEELAARERRLLEAERMAAIGQLAAGVAHELGNPIGIIRGYLKTMSPGGDPDALQEELHILDEEAGHCQRIAEDLLAYARPPELRLERIGMRELLADATSRVRDRATAAGVGIRVDVEKAEIDADPTRLRQAVDNLLVNAVQATPNDSERATIDVSGRVVDLDFEIEIADRGTGIAPADRERVFEPFFSRRRGGTGLGLSVAHGVVQAHGGRIAVHDRPGGGTIFRIVLPQKHVAVGGGAR